MDTPSPTEIITVNILQSQAAELWPLVQRQATDRKGLIFVSVAPYMTRHNSWARLRLQAVFMPHKAANKILKIIRTELHPITPKPSTIETIHNETV